MRPCSCRRSVNVHFEPNINSEGMKSPRSASCSISVPASLRIHSQRVEPPSLVMRVSGLPIIKGRPLIRIISVPIMHGQGAVSPVPTNSGKCKSSIVVNRVESRKGVLGVGILSPDVLGSFIEVVPFKVPEVPVVEVVPFIVL